MKPHWTLRSLLFDWCCPYTRTWCSTTCTHAGADARLHFSLTPAHTRALKHAQSGDRRRRYTDNLTAIGAGITLVFAMVFEAERCGVACPKEADFRLFTVLFLLYSIREIMKDKNQVFEWHSTDTLCHIFICLAEWESERRTSGTCHAQRT